MDKLLLNTETEEVFQKRGKNTCAFRFLILLLFLAVVLPSLLYDYSTIRTEGDSLVINEVMTKNTTFMTDGNGKTCDWLELYNAGSNNINLGNWYITDNDNQLDKFSLPPILLSSGEYRIVFCDGKNYYDRKHDEIHTGFSLSSAGEKLRLISKSGQTESLEIGKSKMNISYGRLEDGTYEWFETPTPGEKNSGRHSDEITDVFPVYPVELKITEFCTSNSVSLPLADGECCGFVTVKNISQKTIRLSDYYLTDSATNWDKWRFPEESFLAPGASRRVICSGLDKQDQNGSLHTSFKLNAKDTVLSLCAGKEAIQTFAIERCAEGVYVVIDERDSSISYRRLNDTTGRKYESAEKAGLAKDLRVVINEVSAVKANGISRKYDWIELYNPTDEDIALDGWKLSDDDGDTQPYVFNGTVIGAGEYLLIYCSKEPEPGGNLLFAGFNLSASGDLLTLIDNEGTVVDSLRYGKLGKGISAGRAEGGSLETVYFSVLTPGKPNAENCVEGYAAMPMLSSDGGIVEKGTKVSLSFSPKGAVCRYTTDGSIPTEDSPVFESIIVEENTVLRVCAFQSGKLRSDPVTATFLTDRKAEDSIPVVCLSSDPDGLFSSENGIYSFGKNFSSSFPYEGANFWQDWERETNFEYYVNGKKALGVPAGIKIFGQYSRGFSQKSFAVYFRNDYGASSIDYPFFADSTHTRFTSLLLRAGGQDQGFTRIRDAYTAQVVKGYTSLVMQDWQPVAVYINGRYWGYYDLREKINAEWLAMYGGMDEDNIDIIKGDGQVRNGTIDRYKNLKKYVNTHDMSKDEHYNYIASQIDIENYIDFLITEIFFVNGDTGNKKMYCAHDGTGKCRWIMFDFDMALRRNAYNYHYNMFEKELNNSGHGSKKRFSTELRWGLLQNSAFRKRFKERFNELLDSAFTPKHMKEVLDRMVGEMKSEMPMHCERWKEPQNYETWEDEINILYTIIERRNEVCRRQLNEFPLLMN